MCEVRKKKKETHTLSHLYVADQGSEKIKHGRQHKSRGAEAKIGPQYSSLVKICGGAIIQITEAVSV